MDKYYYLKEYFGYDQFRKPQDEIIDSVLEGVDTIALMPTGFGKSITFQIPALMFDGLTIVITPLIALMEDQKRNLLKKNIPVEIINSNQTLEEQLNIYLKIIAKKVKILYVSAERLESNIFREKIIKVDIRLIVLDEAHTILWGESFRKAFMNINKFIDLLVIKPRLLALTATATSTTIDKIKYYMQMTDPKIIITPIDRSNIFLKVIRSNKDKYLIDYLKNNPNQKGIIYCLTRKRTEDLSLKLKTLGYSNTYYHGGLTYDVKSNNQKLFTEGKEKLIICTNAFGMGIDIPDISFVINYDLPQSIEDLAQQIGRAARDGRAAEGIVLFDFQDIKQINHFIDSNENLDIRRVQRQKMKNVIDYCLSGKCRHQFISSYFNQAIPKCLTNCDNCKK